MPAKFSDTETIAKRDQILNAVSPVFASKGYEGTTVRDLEQVTGLTRGGIFFYFPSKRDIYLAAIEHSCSQGRGFVRAAALAAPTAEEAMMAVFKAITTWYAEHPEAPQFYQQMAARAGAEPDIADLDQRLSADIDAFITDSARRLQEKGIIGAHVDTEAAAQVMHAVMDRVAANARGMAWEDAEPMARRVMHTMVAGIEPRPEH